MTDRPGNLETQLAVLRPRALPPDLAERIGAGLAERATSPQNDRFLLCAMSAGLLAACVILALFVTESPGLPATTPTVATVPAPPKLGDCLQTVARSDGGWVHQPEY